MIIGGKSIIRLRDADVGYPDRNTVAIKQINLSICGSEVVGITGVSGSGKTTLLRALTQVVPLRRGVREWMAGDAARVAYAPQDDVLLEYRTVWENAALLLESPQAVPEAWDRTRPRIERILSQTGLLGRRHDMPSELSGGMRQRLQVSQALCTLPALLLLDEPFAQQDRGNQRVLELLIHEAAREMQCAIVLVSHDVDALGALCDRTVFLGGSPGRIFEELETPAPLLAVGSDARRQLPGFTALIEQLWATRARASLQ